MSARTLSTIIVATWLVLWIAAGAVVLWSIK